MKTDKLGFIDSNIIVYAIDEESPFFKKANHFINQIDKLGINVCISPQIVGEVYSIITNPKRVRKPLGPNQAVEIIEAIWESGAFIKIYPKIDTIRTIINLIKQYQIKANNFYDAQIVATMLDNNIKVIYTVNTNDFKVFKEIKVINPLE